MHDKLELELEARTEAYYEESRVCFWSGEDVAKLEKSLADIRDDVKVTVEEQVTFLKDLQERFRIPTSKAAANRRKLDEARPEIRRLEEELEVAVKLHEAAKRRVTKLLVEIQEMVGL